MSAVKTILTLGAVSTIATGCIPSHGEVIQGDDANLKAQSVLSRLEQYGIISDQNYEDLSVIKWESNLVYQPVTSSTLSRQLTNSMSIFAQEGIEIPDKQKLDAISIFVANKVGKRGLVRWQPRRNLNMFVLGPNGPLYRPSTNPTLPISVTRIDESILRDQNVDLFYIEFVNSLLGINTTGPFKNESVEFAEALSNEVGIATASAQNGLNYEEYLTSHPDVFEMTDPITRRVNRKPFTQEEYNQIIAIFNPLIMDSDTRTKSILGLFQRYITNIYQDPSEAKRKFENIFSPNVVEFIKNSDNSYFVAQNFFRSGIVDNAYL